MNTHELLTKSEVCAEIGGNVTVSFINGLIARKKLPVVRLGYRTVRIPRKAVAEYIESHTLGGSSNQRTDDQPCEPTGV